MQTYPSLLAVDRTSGAPLTGCVVEVLDAETMASVTTYLDGVARPVVTGAHGTTPVFQTEDSTRRVYMRVPSSDWRAHVWSQEALGTADDARLAAAAQADRAQAAADEARSLLADSDRATGRRPLTTFPEAGAATLPQLNSVRRSGGVVQMNLDFRDVSATGLATLAVLPEWAVPSDTVVVATGRPGQTVVIETGQASVRISDAELASGSRTRLSATWISTKDWPSAEVLTSSEQPRLDGILRSDTTLRDDGNYSVRFGLMGVYPLPVGVQYPFAFSPSSDAPAIWQAQPNTTVIFRPGETKTIRAWARNAAGNVAFKTTTYTAPTA